MSVTIAPDSKTRESLDREIGVGIVTTVTVECGFCDKRFVFETDLTYAREVITRKASNDAFKEGWRYISSDYWAAEGIACPDCVKTEQERD